MENTDKRPLNVHFQGVEASQADKGGSLPLKNINEVLHSFSFQEGTMTSKRCVWLLRVRNTPAISWRGEK